MINYLKETGDEDGFESAYREIILDSLDAKEVYEELGENSILLCWESSEKFCHRHLVAEWLNGKLGLDIEEV